MSPNCERAYFYRGMLLKKVDNFNAAVKDFRKAAELNPRNTDAMREVRLHTMRGPAASAAKADAGGLFGKLFKK
jgi:tetratricopeptide (TPR) repeat protein